MNDDRQEEILKRYDEIRLGLKRDERVLVWTIRIATTLAVLIALFMFAVLALYLVR